MKIRQPHVRASHFALALAMCAAQPAFAQEIENPDEADTGGEIVVTAQKRAENVQDVPISIAVFNQETLTRANVTNLLDLGRIATNFQTVRSSNTGSTRIGVRGVGSLANTLIEPSVAVFLDGVYAQASSPFTQTLRAPEVLTYPGISESRFTYRVSLNYEPNDDIMIFANHSTGYKSSGYNSGGGTPSLSTFDGSGNLVSTKRLFDRETVNNYELGIRSSWLDRALRANLTLYRMDIAGFQDRAFDGVSFIVRNAGSLRQQGFEFDLTMAPARNFSVTGSFAYLDSQFTSFTTASNLPGLPGTQDLTGKPNSFSPQWVGNVAVDWSGDIGSSGLNWAASGNVSFVSDQFVGTVNDANPQSLADGYALLGARLSLNGPDDRWSVSLFGRNLANAHYRPLSVYQPLGAALGLNNTVFPGSTANRVQASEPRTYGVAATFRF